MWYHLPNIMTTLAERYEVVRTLGQGALFESEAKTMAALEHEHIVRVYDYGFAEGQPYLVMELVRGTSLYARLAAERPRIADAVKIARQILAGVEAAHAGTVMGTPSSMAPEQMNGAAVTPAADVYSIGLILHEMLTGQRMYPGNDPVQVFSQRMRHTPAPPSKLDPLVPAALDQVVLRALAPDAAERATAGELAGSLAHWLERERRDAHAGAAPAIAITCFNLLWIVETGLIGIFPRPYLIDRAISGVCALFGVAY